MRTVSHRPPARWLLPFLPLVALACSGIGSGSDVLGDQRRPGTKVAIKGGLDGPPVAVGPFLNGALPSRTPGSPGSSEWTTVPAFPNINLDNTIVIASNPGDNRIYVGSQEGVVVAFENRSDVSTTETFLDLRDRVAVVFEGGFLGLAFHPEFGNSGSPYRKSFYVYYSSHCPLDASRNAADLGACDDSYPRDPTSGFFNTYLRLSRFEVFEGTVTGDPSTEQVLFNVRLYDRAHRGGGLAVRDDGLLYVSIGDQLRSETAQSIVDNFNGSTLRIAVNVIDHGDGTWTCPPGSHQPRRIFDTVDEISGRYYCIPNDNPWLDAAGGVFEEYCAIGLRNPFRLGIDPVRGRVWVGDVGQFDREEVNVIECGNNYGWPFREGTIEGVRPEPSSYLGILTDPVVEFTRDEAQSIIGGYVYRGSRLPELYGLYLVGDFVTNGIWAVALDESTMTGTKTYLTSFSAANLVTWGQDNDGELFLADIYSTGLIYALDQIGDPQPDAPPLLSDTGAFSDVATATPSAFWVPYGLNQPFWSDGASKSRFVALPNDGVRDSAAEQIGFSQTEDWTFPTGTVLMKHFELPLDETDPTVTTRLETRFMVLGDDGEWYGLTYRWRATQLEADLLTGGEIADYTIQRSEGGTRTQTWYFPSRPDCLRCHRQGSGGALGARTHQLNGDFTYLNTGRTDNQILTWNALAMFSPPLDDASISSFVSSPALDDVTAPLQDRARSWLDANCAYCHRPGGVNAGFDARFTTPFVDQGFIGTPVRDDLGNPGTVVLYPGDAILSAIWQRSAAVGSIAMPPLAKELPEQPAVDLLAEWIERLPSAVPNNPPNLINPGDQNNRPGELVTLSLVASDQDGDVLYFDAAGLPPGLTLDHTTGEISGTLSASAADSHNVTVSVSDAIEVSAASFVWSVGEGGSIGTCGDGNLDAGEACDDGNRTSGDGCTTGCVLEVCGDGVVNNGGAEACEPPGTALCTNVCTLRTPRCGDGFLTPPEQCEDGNLVDGDGCGLDCTPEGGADLTYTGTIIARITNPVGGGSKDLEIIRDGDKPPVGNTSSSRQYDTYSGGAVATEDWIGYQYSTDQLFGQVVFQEGKNFVDGGYFLWLTVQVRQQGTWVEAPGVTITPAYAVNDGIHYNTYVLDFDPVVGDALRIYGAPGGSKYFISVGELEVYSASASSLCGNGALDGGEECDDSSVVDGDGCSSTCASEFCGDGVVNNAGAEACEPPGTDVCTASCSIRTPTCGDGSVDLGEGCDDGNTIGGDGCSADCTFETRIDLTDSGAIIARITTPIGGGSKDPEVIRDDDKPPVGNTSSIRQYDTNSGGAVATEDWIGYEYATNQRFGQVVFQEGKNFEDGGYFLWVTVQVRQDGSWIEAPGVTITPAYAVNDGIHFNTYVLDFDPVVGDAIRIYGAPGGSKYFISIGELEVYSAPITGGCSVGNGTAPIDPVILLGVLGLALVRRRRRLRPASSPLAPFSHKVRVAERPSRH